MNETINLDVHAINELKTKKLPPTDDLQKYNYSSDADGTYSKYMYTTVLVWLKTVAMHSLCIV